MIHFCTCRCGLLESKLLSIVHVSVLSPRLRLSVCVSIWLAGSLAWLAVLRINPYTKASHFLGNPPSFSPHPSLFLCNSSPFSCFQHPTLTCKGRQGELQLLYISCIVLLYCVCDRDKQYFATRPRKIEAEESERARESAACV